MTSAFTIDAATGLPGPDWLRERRRGAAERFVVAELPTAEEEVWRYSRIGDLTLDAYSPSPRIDEVPAEAGAILRSVGDEPVVVTVGGHAVRTQLGDSPLVAIEDAGVLGDALGETDDALTALHDAFADPVQIRVPEGTDGGRLYVVHHLGGDGAAAFPRLIVHAAAGSQVTVVEVFVGPDDQRVLSVPVTELVADRDATLRHASVQILGDAAWQIGRVAATVGQNATLTSGTAAFGGDYCRLRADTTLAGRGSHGDLFAGYFGTGTQLLDFRTFQDHVAPDTTSNLLFKGALGEKGASVYTGLIKIRPDARNAQAFQTNRNVKLSEDAWAESVPNLEIENNQVQCSHASTVGPVDPEQRFYLESRGVPTGRAERLIVKGVFDEIIRALPFLALEDVVRDRLDRDLERSLP